MEAGMSAGLAATSAGAPSAAASTSAPDDQEQGQRNKVSVIFICSRSFNLGVQTSPSEYLRCFKFSNIKKKLQTLRWRSVSGNRECQQRAYRKLINASSSEPIRQINKNIYTQKFCKTNITSQIGNRKSHFSIY